MMNLLWAIVALQIVTLVVLSVLGRCCFWLHANQRLGEISTDDDARPFPRIYSPLIAMMLLGSLCCPLHGQEPRTAPPLQAMHIEPGTRGWYRNQPDGCCVQMAIGMCGCNSNDDNAASLPFDSLFGKAERGGSIPSRVERYCDARAIVVYNVTGRSIDETMPWVEWAGKTGRFAAVGFTEAHFQTLYGYDSVRKQYLVCDNNSPHRIDRYDERTFRQKHQECMPWLVVLKNPSSPPPKFIKWW